MTGPFPRSLAEIPTPALLLDLEALDANLRRMADRSRELGVALRPHVKTHKCLEVAERQRELGARGFTVSTLYEARTFAEAGFTDLTWAFPLIPGRAEEAVRLAGKCRLGLTVDSREAIEALETAGSRAGARPLRTWLKVDSGYGRAGVDPHGDEGPRLAEAIHGSRALSLAGILSHAGHTYRGRSPEEVRAAAEEEREVMVGFADRLRGSGIPVEEVSVGSTPGMARVRGLDGVSEARPGNYAFHDHTQVRLGTCPLRACALTVLSTVVSSRPGRERCVLDAGALALSKEAAPGDPPAYGFPFADPEAGAPDSEVAIVSVSQEHGILNRRLPVGSRVRILPIHACLTAACFDEYHVVRGEEVLGRWRVRRGR
ncbi:MAG: alanine racemase [Gemmatimonadota bacterium]